MGKILSKIMSGLKKDEAGEKLKQWQDKYKKAKSAYEGVLLNLKEYNEILCGTLASRNYGGSGNKPEKVKMCRNIVYELIESQVDNNIPTPKCTATREEDIKNAIRIENKLRNEVDRLNFETMLDVTERETPTDGGSFFLVEWDNTKKTHTTVGELSVKVLNASQVIPQPGIYVINDMDYIFVRIAQTKEFIKQQYDVDVYDEGESEPEAKSYTESQSDELVTQIICYYKNENGGIGRYSFVNDVCLEDIPDYQARVLRRCKKCGEVCYEDKCECGSRSFEFKTEEFEVLDKDIGKMEVNPETGEEIFTVTIPKGSEIPYYKPNVYPIVMRKNVSKYGSFLGESDINVIKYQQDIINKAETDILEKMMMGGSIVTLPEGLNTENSDKNFRIVRVKNIQDIEMIKAINLQPDTGRIENFAESQYQRARQLLGITDSFQGRKDSTAVSGTAKQAAIQQTAGRLESKRIMKNACFADLYEVMTKFLIAFADEPRSLIIEDRNGDSVYSTFTKYDFIKRDDEGKWYYSLDYLFSTDASGTLASNREAMWQENSANLSKGAFGNPQEPETLLVYWQAMEQNHYPNASKIKAQVKEKIRTDEIIKNLQMQNEQLIKQNQELTKKSAYFEEGVNQLTARNHELSEESQNYRTQIELMGLDAGGGNPPNINEFNLNQAEGGDVNEGL